MKYEFGGTVEFRENENSIAVPFNVWEVCEKIGDAPVRVCFDDVCFTCDLLPKGQGYYDIPVDESTLSKVELGKKYLISIEIVGNAVEVSENSPYSVEHPIRKIDGVELVTQPWDGLCGQACIAMIAGTSLDEACDIMKCREWQANILWNILASGMPRRSYIRSEEMSRFRTAVLLWRKWEDTVIILSVMKENILIRTWEN